MAGRARALREHGSTVRYYHDGDRVIAESSDLRGVRRLVPGDRGLDEVVQVTARVPADFSPPVSAFACGR